MLPDFNLKRNFENPSTDFDHDVTYEATDCDASPEPNIAHESSDRHAGV